jgi:hypothetical protein
MPKSVCDTQFVEAMVNECARVYGGPLGDEKEQVDMCEDVALGFYVAVLSPVGQSAYDDAQMRVCDCCGCEGSPPLVLGCPPGSTTACA